MSRQTTALAPWYGSDRMVMQQYGDELKDCRVLGIPFGGGMGMAALSDAPTIHVNEKHALIVNLARAVADADLRRGMIRSLKWMPFCLRELRRCQEICRDGAALLDDNPTVEDQFRLARAYFACVWMGRNGTAGTKSELTTGLSTRYKKGGGDSVVRFHSSLRMLSAFGVALRQCTLHHGDFGTFLGKMVDSKHLGLYVDCPWDGPGDDYIHPFVESDFRRLGECLLMFEESKVVVRINDTPLIREVFPESEWTWRLLGGRDQHNQNKVEAMLIRCVAQGRPRKLKQKVAETAVLF